LPIQGYDGALEWWHEKVGGEKKKAGSSPEVAVAEAAMMRKWKQAIEGGREREKGGVSKLKV
jgi:hypothetical protein